MFQGAFTAVVTPFKDDGGIDFEAFEKLIEWQIEQGIQGIVPCGSTGEAITMTADECAEVIARCVKVVNKRVPVIAGTGGSATAQVIEATQRAKQLGADAALINTPAYNKPQQEGLYLHFAAVASACDLPIVLYNVPGRTAITMSTEICARLDEKFANIVAYKDACGDLGQTEAILSQTSLTVMSGDDGLTLAMMALGAKGVISVASNVVPRAVADLAQLCAAGKVSEARELNRRLTPVYDACFVESNPVPAKAGLALMGRCTPHARLPLAPISEPGRAAIKKALTDFGAL